jgi:2-aminomuconate deaminase
MTSIILEDRAPALAAYPHARVVGDLIFVSGISCRRPDGSHAGVGDIRVQTREVLQNIDRILAAAGASVADVVDITVFLVKMDDYGGMNEVYNEFFNKETGPARTTVAVHQLPHPNLLVEMKAVAARPAS